MKNHLSRLGLSRKASEAHITDAIADAMHDSVDRQSVLDAETVLTQKATRAFYERTHLQYEAIKAALDCLNAPNALDSHQWQEQVKEFDTDSDDELL